MMVRLRGRKGKSSASDEENRKCFAVQVKEIGFGAAQREFRKKLLDAARRREIDVVLVRPTDRRGRSVADLLATLQELEHLGVGFVSMTEALDLATPAGCGMAGLLAVSAAFERDILRERVRARLAHARQNGKRPGRPATVVAYAAEIRKLHRAGIRKSEIARGPNREFPFGNENFVLAMPPLGTIPAR